MRTDHGILYIEPSNPPSAEPVIDEYTRCMAAALRGSKLGITWRGCHQCSCGVLSSNADYILPSGEQTNSLCVHYLAYHRDEVPFYQLEKVRAFSVEPVEPTTAELCAPTSR